MTEENNPYKNKSLDVNVSVDRSLEVEALRAEKDAEILELKNTLTQIAQRELDSRCEKYNISKDLSDDVKIAKIKEAELNRSQYSTALLNDQQISGNNDNEGFDSEEDMVLALNRASKANNPKAKEIINKLGAKYLEKPVNIEYEGKITDLARKPVKGSKESETDWNNRLADYQKRQKYRDLNSVKSEVE